VDDVLGHTENWSKHMEILLDFFERVRKANLCLRPSKCKIGFDQVKFLGHKWDLTPDLSGTQQRTRCTKAIYARSFT